MLFVGCLAAKAGDWILAYEDSQFSVYFYDEIHESYGKFGVWEKWVYKKAQVVRKKYYIEQKCYVEYDSDFTTRDVYEVLYYNKSHKLVESISLDYPETMRVAPETVGADIAGAIYDWVYYDDED